ncbi:MAG: Flp pilus assembly protein CpaB [Acidimicrobiia bacterium]
MRRKIIGIVAAVVLAAVGTLALVGYVRSAKDRAVAGERLVEVYVLDGPVPKGASLELVRGAVKREEVPAKVRAEDAVTDLSDLDADLLAGVDLRPGEQLLRSRLVDPADLARARVPEGRQELSVALEPERAVGGTLRAGDTVGVVLSFDPFKRGGGSETSNMTHMILHKVVVTSVQFDPNETETASDAVVPSSRGDDGDDDENGDGNDGEEVDRAPQNRLIVTLALTAPEVERVVFAAEFGHIWLTAEGPDADESGTRIVTLPEAIGAPREALGQSPAG